MGAHLRKEEIKVCLIYSNCIRGRQLDNSFVPTSESCSSEGHPANRKSLCPFAVGGSHASTSSPVYDKLRLSCFPRRAALFLETD
jgi:hypothetical protein